VTGPFGIVTINLRRGKLLHSSDGIAWTMTDLPREITQAGASSSDRFSASAAATEDGVLMLLWEGERGEQRPSWWLGTLS
jgi:hypothetical protein